MKSEPVTLEADGSISDPYKVAASRLFNVPYDKVTPEQRREAKGRAMLGMYRTTVRTRFA